MKNRITGILTLGALAIGLGWTLGAQQAAPADKAATDKADNRTWKDTAEYDIYNAAHTSTDPKARLPLIDKWTQGYPQSDFTPERDDMYLTTYRQLNDCKKATEWALRIRRTRPNEFQPIIAILGCVYQFMPPTAEELTNAEAVAHYTLDHQDVIFAESSRGQQADAATWATYKPQTIPIAQKTIAWVPVQQKNDPKSEVEITKYLGIDGTQATFSYYLSTAMLNQIRAKTEPADKLPISLFHSARAAAYTGPNAMADANRKQIEGFLTTSYTKYHGSTEGLPELLLLAKANVFPPPGFNIEDINSINQRKADDQAKKDAAQPDLTMWREIIRTPLMGADGQMVFDTNFKDAKLPAGYNGVMAFKGKIISMTPTDKPKQLVLAVFDPNVADATLNMTEALPGTMPVGEIVQFSGVPKSYNKDPFMIMFEAEPADISGWTGTNPKGTKAAPASKGGSKGGAKGPAPASKSK